MTSFAKFINDVQSFNSATSKSSPNSSPYRKYIEHIMKTRGLGKSLSFLHRLHNVIMQKVQVSLEKLGWEDVELDLDIFDEDFQQDHIVPIPKEQEEELRR